MLEKLKQVISENPIEDIYLTGAVYVEDNGIAEFIPDTRYLYFEFGSVLVEFRQFDPPNQTSKLCIKISESIRHVIGCDDVISSKSKITQLVLANPLAEETRVKSLCFHNLEAKENEILCDALHLKLSFQQDLFMDPSFLGINIGGTEVEKVWNENLLEGFTSEKTCIQFDRNND